MKRVLFLLCVAVLCTELCFSQVLQGEKAAELIKGARTVRISKLSGNPSFIRFDKSFQLIPADLTIWLAENISIPKDAEFSLLKTDTDQLGFTHHKYQQLINGFPVEGAILIAHARNNKVESVNGEIFNLKGNYQTGISEQAALQQALDYFEGKVYMWEIPEEEAALKDIQQDPDATYYPKGTLVLTPEQMNFKNKFHLTYKFDIYSQEPHKRAYVYVDAASGKVIGDISIINYGDAVGTAITKYSGSKSITADSQTGYYRLRESGRGGGIRTYNLNQDKKYSNAVDFTDTDNYWDNVNPQQDEAATDAHWAAEMTYDYYLNTFGRNSFDDQGTRVVNYVHYDSSYANAFFNGTSLVYGDGRGPGTTFTGPLTPLDICAHEFTHGVTKTTAGLYYERESGALNESFSDIFGTAIEFTAKPSTADWIIAKENTNNATGIRDMGNPSRLHDPDTYHGNSWVSTTPATCDTLNDYCGVHSNSGVQNYWFYLLSQGGSGTNDQGDAYSITGIGIQKAAAIAYRSLTVYLSPTSEYADARFYAIEAANDLYGGCSNEAIQTTNSWYAVGVGDVFDDDVAADFTSNSVFRCTGAGFYFTDNSVGASAYRWDFGDGTSSTLKNPSKNYGNSIATYSVRLVATNNICSDTTYKEVYVSGLTSASCIPVFLSVSGFYPGVSNVKLNTINNATSVNTGYYDYSCTYSTSLKQSVAIPVSISTASNSKVRVWIDYDNNGVFDPVSELAFSDDNSGYTHNGLVKPPSNSLLNKPLRMRVTGAIWWGSIAPCDTLYAEAEDYAVIITANLEPPVAAFDAESEITCNGTIAFHDSSLNAVTSWLWNFGDGNTSTQQHSVHTYAASGSYDVSLIVCGSHGCDTLTKEGYSKVFSASPSCDTTYLPSGIDTLYLNNCFGNLMSGGSIHNGRTIIAPPGAQNITLYVYYHYYYSPGSIKFYDGTDMNSPLLGGYATVFSGKIDTFTSTGNSIFIYQTSGGSDPREGFGAFWVANGPAVAPVADFSIIDTNPPLNMEVQFTDLSYPPFGSWTWNFGDGSYSTEKNPLHIYHSDGTYQVSLSIENCYGQDSMVKNIQVQKAPSISIDMDSLNLHSVNCDSLLTIPLTIYNSGLGDLAVKDIVAKQSSYGTVGDSSVLIIKDNSNLLSTITNQFLQFGVNADRIHTYQIDTTDFLKYDIIYLYEYEPESYYSALNYYLPRFESFAKAGGIILYAIDRATYSYPTVHLADSAISIIGGESYNTVLLPNHPLSQNLTTTLFTNYANSTSLSNLPASAKIIIETTNAHLPTIAEYDFEKGKIIASGISMTNNAQSYTAQLLYNTLAYSLSLINKPASWLAFTSSQLTIAPGDSAVVNVTIDPQSLTTGDYFTNIYVTNNDTQQSLITIPVYFSLQGSPRLALSDTCIAFGNVAIGLPVTNSVNISNEGCDTLNVYDVNSTSDDFIVDDTSFSVLPGQAYSLRITHAPTLAGNATASFEILNNYRDTAICVSGNGFFPPIIVVMDTQLEITVQRCKNLAIVPFTISNSGLSALNWVFNASGTGLSANPRNGSINSEDSIVINLVLTISGLNNGQYTREFSILSNDRTQPVIAVPITMNVVSDSCVPKPAFSFINLSCDNIVRFTDSTTNNPISRQWQFGDGTSSSSLSPSHAYTNPAPYTVTLTATNTYGSASTTKVIDVNYVRVSIAAFDTSYVGETVQLNSNSKGASSWDWAFGDNQISDLENPTHVYNDIGNFSITLSAQNNMGCTYSDSFLITINPPVSVNQISSDNSVKIYPNPTGQIIYLEIESITGNEIIRIHNPVGKIVYEKELQHRGINKQEINVASYPKATYMVEIIGDVIITKKIVID